MESQTSEVVKYEIRIGHAKFTLMDTPGFGDTRGNEIDEEQADKIRQSVLKEGGINCICVVQNGRESRMTDQLRYSYMSLMEILPKSVTNQIIAVYTNCESDDFMAFDHESLNDVLGLENDISIPYVCVENSLATNQFRNLVARDQKLFLTDAKQKQ